MAGYSEKEKEKALAAAKESGGSSSGPSDLQDAVGNEALKEWFGKAPKGDKEYPNINLDAARLAELEPEYDKSEGDEGGGVKYLTKEERKRAKVHKGDDGKLYRVAADGSHVPLADQFTNMYAISPKGSLYIYQPGDDIELPEGNAALQHSSFTGGRPVQAAGYLKTEGGGIPSIGAESGHYKPKPGQLQDAALGLMAKGFVDEELELLYSGADSPEPLYEHSDERSFTPQATPKLPKPDK